ncbi:uncharacterized protein MYCFIDRAFT_171908 [Pseudocercospora fijiensis CIRAD86]|uniref:Uncharacterized protein n=1 Tax=Pseudocercospora fijiensis (strain CIRAD86) TaxID=383855 RepID=M3BA21_PSEFD|nr:uncharacterized protein MYCFIDRAFT_171908 [Pseudocercospora fijiensis CIRAD86]EME86103.1 hypothetical protein MYCFIDRAFT_171908 [Pseudocercospora fijiensis CIRAD86]
MFGGTCLRGVSYNWQGHRVHHRTASTARCRHTATMNHEREPGVRTASSRSARNEIVGHFMKPDEADSRSSSHPSLARDASTHRQLTYYWWPGL